MALAESLKKLSQEMAPVVQSEPDVPAPEVEEQQLNPAQLARTAVDYVLSQLREEDSAEVLGDTVAIAASALAVDLGVEPAPLVHEAALFLAEAALAAGAHDDLDQLSESLSESTNNDYAGKLKRAQSDVARAVAFARQKLAKGDKAGAKKFIRNARGALQTLERFL